MIHYDQAQGRNDAHFKLQHRQTGFKDVTDQGYPDTVNDIICGSTSTLSLFAVTEAVAVGGTVELLTGAAPAQPDRGSARGYATPAIAAGVAVAIAALGCAIWDIRRRRLRREP